MVVQSYLFIEAQPRYYSEVGTNLRNIKSLPGYHPLKILNFDMVTGPWDMMALVEADALSELGHYVERMRDVKGVTKIICGISVSV